MRRNTCLSVAALLLVAAAGCSSSEAAPSTTTTAAPTTAAAPATTEAGVTLPEPGEPWDLLVLSAMLYQFDPPVTAEWYRRRAEEMLGVEVRMPDTRSTGREAYYMLGHIRGERYPSVAEMVRESEIIVLYTAPERSDEGRATAIDDLYENCEVEASHMTPEPPDLELVHSEAFWAPYRVLLEEIYEEIWRLREGTPTVLIAVDRHDFDIFKQRRAGIEEECRVAFEAWADLVREVGEAHGATFVSTYDLLNGPDHDIDPLEAGYVGPTDEYPLAWYGQPNEVGASMIVDALAAVGFDPVAPPEG
jgi:hypothetical protein